MYLAHRSRRPPSSPLFPYTTLFRSRGRTGRTRCTGRDRPPPCATSTGSPRPPRGSTAPTRWTRSEEHTSELQSHSELVCRLLLENKVDKTTLCLWERNQATPSVRNM